MSDKEDKKTRTSDTTRMLTVFFASMAVALLLGLVFIFYKGSTLQVRRNNPPKVPMPPHSYVNHVFRPLGGLRFEIRSWGRSLTSFLEDCDQAEGLVEALEREISTWRKESPAWRLNAEAAGKEIFLPKDLCALMKKAFEFSRLTKGAFNPALGPAVELWKVQAGQGRRPSAEELREVRPFTDLDSFRLRSKECTCVKISKRARIDLSALGVGYVVDRVFDLLVRRGNTDLYLRCGYEVRILSQVSRKVAIEDPQKPGRSYGYIYLKEGALSTAGTYVRPFEIEGKRFGRVLDPSTLEPVPGVVSVTVIAPEATAADALATGLLVLGPKKGLSFLKDLPGVEALYLFESKGKLVQRRSPGFPEVLDIRAENEPFPLP